MERTVIKSVTKRYKINFVSGVNHVGIHTSPEPHVVQGGIHGKTPWDLTSSVPLNILPHSGSHPSSRIRQIITIERKNLST
jgi:hypothetical protein